MIISSIVWVQPMLFGVFIAEGLQLGLVAQGRLLVHSVSEMSWWAERVGIGMAAVKRREIEGNCSGNKFKSLPAGIKDVLKTSSQMCS